MLSRSVIRFIEKNRQWKVYVHDENITEEDEETLTMIQFAEKRILSSRGQGFPKGNGDMNYQRGGEIEPKVKCEHYEPPWVHTGIQRGK